MSDAQAQAEAVQVFEETVTRIRIASMNRRGLLLTSEEVVVLSEALQTLAGIER